MKKNILVIIGLFFMSGLFQSVNAQDGMLGEIRMFAGNFAPRGWALCQGQLLSISSNSALFSILGTTYGGDGRTTFGLPDMRGRMPMGTGRGPGLTSRSIGQKGGREQFVLVPNNLPAAKVVTPAFPLDPSNDSFQPKKGTRSVVTIGNESNRKVSSTVQGISTPVRAVSPYQAVNFIICIQGVFPSRS